MKHSNDINSTQLLLLILFEFVISTSSAKAQILTPSEQIPDQCATTNSGRKIKVKELLDAVSQAYSSPQEKQIQERENKNLTSEEHRAIDYWMQKFSEPGLTNNTPTAVKEWFKKYGSGFDLVKNPDDLSNLYLITTIFYPRLLEINSKEKFYANWLKKHNQTPLGAQQPIIRVLKDGQPLSDISELHRFKGLTVKQEYPEHGTIQDDRPLDELDGWGDNKIFVGRVSNIMEGRIAFHEFAHFLHMSAMNSEDIDTIEKLYIQAKTSKKILDEYSALNQFEYFAVGIQAYLNNHQHSPAGTVFEKVRWNPNRYDLLKADADLYDFIEKLVGKNANEALSRLAVKDQK